MPQPEPVPSLPCSEAGVPAEPPRKHHRLAGAWYRWAFREGFSLDEMRGACEVLKTDVIAAQIEARGGERRSLNHGSSRSYQD